MLVPTEAWHYSSFFVRSAKLLPPHGALPDLSHCLALLLHGAKQLLKPRFDLLTLTG